MNRKSLLLILLFLLIGFSFIYYNSQQNGEDLDKQGIRVKLYFSTKDAMYLQSEERVIEDKGIPALYMETIKLLIKGPDSKKLTATIPHGVEIINIEIRGETAYLNFNKSLVENHWGGSTGETMTVYSIVNTMTQFSGINSVQIMVDNEPLETLAGHLDLSVPLEGDERIIKEE